MEPVARPSLLAVLAMPKPLNEGLSGHSRTHLPQTSTPNIVSDLVRNPRGLIAQRVEVRR